MAKCTWRNAATAVSDVRFYDDRYIRCVFLAGWRQFVDDADSDLF
jgi:hypothetical protein